MKRCTYSAVEVQIDLGTTASLVLRIIIVVVTVVRRVLKPDLYVSVEWEPHVLLVLPDLEGMPSLEVQWSFMLQNSLKACVDESL